MSRLYVGETAVGCGRLELAKAQGKTVHRDLISTSTLRRGYPILTRPPAPSQDSLPSPRHNLIDTGNPGDANIPKKKVRSYTSYSASNTSENQGFEDLPRAG